MLKLNVGFNRKVGESNYGSRGASVNLEMELSSELASDPDKLKGHIRQMFSLVKASVDEELNCGASPTSNGHASNGNSRKRDNTRKATASQVKALHAIADRQQLDLAQVLRARFAIDQAEGLSITEASELIDVLKAQSNGNGCRR